MRKGECLALLGLASWLALAPAAPAQRPPYIGFAYPAGGQQGTTVQIRLGGQYLDDVNAAMVTGSGVTARVAEYYRRLNNQELQLLREQLKELKQVTSAVATAKAPRTTSESSTTMMSEMTPEPKAARPGTEEAPPDMIARIERRTREFVQTPACASIASLVVIEVTIAADAEPGEREVRLATSKGVSNPLPFHIGQWPEYSRKPMITAAKQVLGKEEQALRKRLADEVEDRVTVPATLNGQIASGEVNRYRFAARKDQRLVIITRARQLVPYIADAVPGWFQPVLALYNAQGKEVAYADDYRFRPDPVMLYEVPRDGEYVLAITDAIYRGREDFVYRITLGEGPWVTSLFPLGAQVGAAVTPKMHGWNLEGAVLTPPAKDAGPGIYPLAATRKGFVSNRVPFVLDLLPDGFDQEPNNTRAVGQPVKLPLIVNGRVDQPDDWDVFQFAGKSNDMVVAEVQARRLDSPLDAVIKLTDAAGQVLAFNDDREDLGTGLNTHHADCWFLARLPADGTYYVHLGDTARQGGEAYGYRLRLSAPQPDFELRAVPSSVSLRSKSTGAVTIHVIRRDGFTGPIKLTLKDPPPGFSAAPVTMPGNRTVTRFTIKTDQVATAEPVRLSIVGTAKIGQKEITREAVPADDQMQAFLWRHLVPASDLKALVYDPNYKPPSKRVAPPRLPAKATTNAVAATNAAVAAAMKKAVKPRFTKQQVAGRLRQLKLLFEEGVLADDFYLEKVAECEALQ